MFGFALRRSGAVNRIAAPGSRNGDGRMSEDLVRVSERLRRGRAEAALSLQALAKRSGVAASTIQKIERRQMVPSIAVLLKVAHGLGRRPSEFLDEHAPEREIVLTRAAERRLPRFGVERRVAPSANIVEDDGRSA